MFDNFGVQFEGKWLNKKTNEFVNVTNHVFDGDNIIIMTNQGQIDMETFMRDYIQIGDNNEYDEKGHVVGKADDNKLIESANNSKMKTTTIFDQEYDFAPTTKPILVNSNTKSTQSQHNKPTEKIKNENIIQKFFDKLNDKPQIEINIKWDNFPKEQISTLVDFLDVDINDISKYMRKLFLNDESISLEISKIIMAKLNDSKRSEVCGYDCEP